MLDNKKKAFREGDKEIWRSIQRQFKVKIRGSVQDNSGEQIPAEQYQEFVWTLIWSRIKFSL